MLRGTAKYERYTRVNALLLPAALPDHEANEDGGPFFIPCLQCCWRRRRHATRSVTGLMSMQISKLDVKKDTIVEAMRRRCHAISDADRADVEARIVGELHSLGWEDLKGDWEDENCGAANE